MSKKIHPRQSAKVQASVQATAQASTSARAGSRRSTTPLAVSNTKAVNPQNPCASEVLKTVPVVMRNIIRHMHSGHDLSLSVPQFRVIVFILRHSGSSLAQLANFLGMTPPSTSKLVDALVRQDLVERQVDAIDRRRITLNITPKGLNVHDQSQRHTLDYLTSRLNDLDTAQQRTITRAMVLLYQTFAPPESPQQSHPVASKPSSKR